MEDLVLSSDEDGSVDDSSSDEDESPKSMPGKPQSNKKKRSSTNSPKKKSHPNKPKMKSSASDAASKGKVDSAKSTPSKQHRKKQKAPENLSNKDVPSHAKKFKKRKTNKRLRTLMDSRRFHQATGLKGCHHDKNDARNVVDLTLKLGFGNHAARSHRINLIDLFNTPAPMTTPDLANFNFNAGSNTSANKGINFGPTNGAQEHVVLNHLGKVNNGIACGGGGGSVAGLNANGIACGGGGGSVAAEIDFGMIVRGDHSQGGRTYKSVARGKGNQHPSNFSNTFNTFWTPSRTLNTHTLSNGSSRDRQIGSSYGFRRRGPRRSRQICYFDPHKRCTNFNCNTRNTPMWRNGPLGPKSLCNACGIKYKKEEDRRKARGATNKRNNI
ncbi:PREDICTED: uncharacterized protein LOC105126280 [Populus euphratica]|uniref:Uncharacterized protein LOC105126280 n=1 Tax=Populus euphratica TaxID=75702 RepID=A0AAJ6UA08_POPEU|nr:PREDICTED: uncharacterized protein LOC105126280 [Populus euphratica]